MQMSTAFLVIISAGVLLGCSEPPTIDGTSNETLEATTEVVRESLPDSTKVKFDEALQVVAFEGIGFGDLLAYGAMGDEGGEVFATELRSKVDGMTAEEVIAKADLILEQRRAKEREQALQEIDELSAKKVQSDLARSELERFEVTRSRFYKRDGGYWEEPIIELSVVNGTSHPISRAYFAATVASPGRAVPWIKETFNYSIPGGVEAGENASWSLAPNRFDSWGTVDVPSDAILTVETTRLDGADGEVLFSTQEFTDEDAKRLDELSQKFQAP